MQIQLEIPDDNVGKRVLGMYKSGRPCRIEITFRDQKIVELEVKEVLISAKYGTDDSLPQSARASRAAGPFVQGATGVYIVGKIPQ